MVYASAMAMQPMQASHVGVCLELDGMDKVTIVQDNAISATSSRPTIVWTSGALMAMARPVFAWKASGASTAEAHAGATTRKLPLVFKIILAYASKVGAAQLAMYVMQSIFQKASATPLVIQL
jgi:hypothetical protein